MNAGKKKNEKQDLLQRGGGEKPVPHPLGRRQVHSRAGRGAPRSQAGEPAAGVAERRREHQARRLRLRLQRTGRLCQGCLRDPRVRRAGDSEGQRIRHGEKMTKKKMTTYVRVASFFSEGLRLKVYVKVKMKLFIILSLFIMTVCRLIFNPNGAYFLRLGSTVYIMYLALTADLEFFNK